MKIFTPFEHSEKSQREIAMIVGVSECSVSRIVNKGVTTGSLSPKKESVEENLKLFVFDSSKQT